MTHDDLARHPDAFERGVLEPRDIEGAGLKPERGDTIFKVGSFAPDEKLGPHQHSLSVPVGSAAFLGFALSVGIGFVRPADAMWACVLRTARHDENGCCASNPEIVRP